MLLLLCLIVFWCVELIGYLCLLPDSAQRALQAQPWLERCGTLLYGVAYVLSLLRTPLGLLPYLVKVWLLLGLKMHYEARRTTYAREVVNLLAEITNLLLSWYIVWYFIGEPRLQWLAICCYLPLYAECVRLLAERLPMLFSAAWQLLPHHSIAQQLAQWIPEHQRWRSVQRYVYYYRLSAEDKEDYVLTALKRRADPEVARRLSYLRTFRIVPQKQALRGGLVRDVAKGEVFIHAIWTHDPWLLIGMALRRAPWSFDPRYLRRPFAYMSEANRSMSLFVLRHARYSLPYAIFQFGHEIRVARLHCFYALLRWLGADIERRVWVDGTFQNDQLIFWLQQQFAPDTTQAEPRVLYSDDEVIAELTPLFSSGISLSAQEIAECYVYPLAYIEEVLLPLLRQSQKERIEENIS